MYALPHALCRQLQRFLDDQRGNTLMIVGLSLLSMAGAMGAAVDMGRSQIVQSKMSSSLDAAGLAAGATINSTDFEAEAQKYFNANFVNAGAGVTITNFTVTPNEDNSILTLNATATVPTTVMKVLGIETVTVSASSEITRESKGMELVLVLDNTGSMDWTLGTSEKKIDALKAAVNDDGGLLDILYGDDDTVDDLYVGVVPFSYMVNIGTSHSAWYDSSYNSGLNYGPVVTGTTCPTYSGSSPNTSVSGTYFSAITSSSIPKRCTYNLVGASAVANFGLTNWRGCVLSRSYTNQTLPTLAYDISDDVPNSSDSATLFKAFRNPNDATAYNSSSPANSRCKRGSSTESDWYCTRSTGSGSSASNRNIFYADNSSYGSGPNNGCPAAEVLPMTQSKAAVKARVAQMNAVGSTMINLGLAWGWRMLSDKWTGLWGGEMNTNTPQLPLPYNTPLMNKVVVLMTDGMNSAPSDVNTSAYQGQSTLSNSQLDARTAALCTAMKNAGIIIYTVGFGTDDDNNPSVSTSVNGPMLTACASKNEFYFFSPTSDDLKQDFKKIGDSLANLRISK